MGPGVSLYTLTISVLDVVRVKKQQLMATFFVFGKVSILGWRLGSGSLAVAYLHGSAIEAAIAVPGEAVRTIMGLGTVELVREDGVIVVMSGGIDGGSSTSMPPSSNPPR